MKEITVIYTYAVQITLAGKEGDIEERKDAFEEALNDLDVSWNVEDEQVV